MPTTHRACAVNISRTGLRIRLTASFAAGELVKIKSHTIRAVANVKFCQSAGEGEFELGLEIVSVGKIAVLNAREHMSLVSSTLYLAEALADDDMESTRKHLASCRECRSRLNEVADAVFAGS